MSSIFQTLASLLKVAVLRAIIHQLLIALLLTASFPAGVSGEDDSQREIRITLAQIPVATDVDQNLQHISDAFDTAVRDKADWILFPEGSLSGYTPKIDQQEVAVGFERVKELCKENSIAAIMGTSWTEEGRTFNQMRAVDRNGDLGATYAKMCLCYNENFEPGTKLGVGEMDGVRFGMLICNDMWVTPGYSDGPNPHLSKRLAEQNVDLILHSVNSGLNQKFRGYHEENLKIRAAEAKCPFVVVNAAKDKPLNCTSGVVRPFEYAQSLPREGRQIRTLTVQLPSRQTVDDNIPDQQ